MAARSSSDRIFALLSTEDNIVVIDPPKFDLESYIQNYSGRTRLDRLVFIGRHSVSLCVDALKAAVAEAKRGRDIGRYKIAQEVLALVSPNEGEAQWDSNWVDRVVKENSVKTKRLDDELKGYKNNLIKESIRMGKEDIGLHYQDIGDPERAYDAFSQMRQDVFIQKHLIDMSRRLISVGIEQEKWVLVQSNVQKIMTSSQSADEERALQPYLKICMGLALLADGKFYDAALQFLAVTSGMGSTYNDIVTSNDVAVYGGLCALASMNRDELQRRVLDNSNFRTYLELEPHIRRAVAFFVNGRYSACLASLEGYRNDYLLDMYLQKHVTEIYHLIRSKSIIQYFIPFSCVTLDTLNEAFASPEISIEDELISMIERGTLDARLDMQNRLLLSVPSVPRAALQTKALASAKAYERELLYRVQRMNIIGANLEVKGFKKTGGQGLGSHPNELISYSDNIRTHKGFSEQHGNDSGYE